MRQTNSATVPAMKRVSHVTYHLTLAACLSLATALLGAETTQASTGTFIDRQAATDLRIVSYNVLWDRIFPDSFPTQAAKFERVFTALAPDILNLQEIGNPFCNDCIPGTAEDVRLLLNELAPIGGDGWHVHKGSDNVIASKFPLSLQATDTTPSGDRGQAIALVNLPDDQFPTDFYLLNNHYKCCGSPGGFEDDLRQRQSDAIVNWIRDARTPGGFVDLAPGTPIAVVGDLNIVGGLQPLETLIDGNIIDEGTYGNDASPDWDGTNFTDARPRHNGTGADDYTWRNDASPFAPGRLDYVIYSDSALDVGNQFVLNTAEMSAQELLATGLQTFDVTVDSFGVNYDHLPLVVDFRLFDFSTADFNFDRAVDASDLAAWQLGYGISSGATRADGDTDQDADVDGGDFLRWQRERTTNSRLFSTTVPEPSAAGLLFLAAGVLLVVLR